MRDEGDAKGSGGYSAREARNLSAESAAGIDEQYFRMPQQSRQLTQNQSGKYPWS